MTDRAHDPAPSPNFGGLHILVNNARVTRDNLLFKMTAADWATVMAVHLQGALLMTQLTQVHMVKARYGRIISLSSASALGDRGRADSAAKAGIQGFTRTLEIKLGPFGITANSIAPRFIETAMTEVRSGKPVTNQVTTTPGNGRRSATYPDTGIPPTCGNPTQPDGIRRNRHAW